MLFCSFIFVLPPLGVCNDLGALNYVLHAEPYAHLRVAALRCKPTLPFRDETWPSSDERLHFHDGTRPGGRPGRAVSSIDRMRRHRDRRWIPTPGNGTRLEADSGTGSSHQRARLSAATAKNGARPPRLERRQSWSIDPAPISLASTIVAGGNLTISIRWVTAR